MRSLFLKLLFHEVKGYGRLFTKKMLEAQHFKVYKPLVSFQDVTTILQSDLISPKNAYCTQKNLRYPNGRPQELHLSVFFKECHFSVPGLRKCPADDLAQMEVFLVLTNLLQAFSFRAPSGDNGAIGTFYKAGTSVLRNPKPFYVVMQNRK